MPQDGRREERDLVLNPRQYALVLDSTKGQINCYVGPHKTSLADTDRPVVYADGDFDECDLRRAIQQFAKVDEGSYMVLQNPASGDKPHPPTGAANAMVDLDEGRKINIPGPVTFPLWPGQTADAVDGHQLRSNEYLICRVYNADAAKANWGQAIVQPVTQDSTGEAEGEEGDETKKEGEDAPEQSEVKDAAPIKGLFGINPSALTMGQLLVVRGTDVSFYIPPTGIEVLVDDDLKYVRQAVTLERLEFCILLDENGNKRYTRGPDVVFPKPTERFVQRIDPDRRGDKKTRRFRAIELNEISGLYIKVIDPYTEIDPETGEERSYEEGEEIFITGREQAIYFPRPEHAVLRYGDHEVHYAVAIPAGEARYVMNRLTGSIDTMAGPKMLLPDPRSQVIVRRILNPDTVGLWYPGNVEALSYNTELAAFQEEEQTSGFVTEPQARRKEKRRAGRSELSAQVASQDVSTRSLMPRSYGAAYEEPTADEALIADAMERKTQQTKPRMLVLDTKYEGAPSVSVWTGYAIMVVSKTGKRKVVCGPETAILEYDETLEVLELSRGKPKNTDNLLRTVYLRVAHNKIGDIVQAETKDLVEVGVKLSYRVNFEGEDTEKWFAVENYVKFLCDHIRSMLRSAIKKIGIEEFNDNATDIIRDTVLGKTGESGKRTGRAFAENNMCVYDVEVLEVSIGDRTIGDLLMTAQHAVVQSTLELRTEEHKLETEKRREIIAQELETARQETALHTNKLATEAEGSIRQVAMAQIETMYSKQIAELNAKEKTQEGQDVIIKAELVREKLRLDHRQEAAKIDQDLRVALMNAETDAQVKQIEAVREGLVEAINNFGDKVFMEKLMEALGPHALLQGTGVAGVLEKLLAGSPGVGDRIAGLIGKVEVTPDGIAVDSAD
ncbi:hypothetical protein LCGC14_0165450 [marine sediment metagenome]|uniref:Major vault protein shoulder domain-containing protein n=1 Tax=marine sediment metagenome TaxID=412755 RepID=A0A0F9XD29_9ZZZZ